ncbi:MAG: glycosyltransferase family 4 protein [Flavobacterium sp.]|nr:glycosyltransferase family 4 protein [Flavobacterium sp.]
MKKIAVVCNYPLLSDRIGGMDRFFWLFDKQCKANHFEINWYFSEEAIYEGYSELKIFSSNKLKLESFFIQKIRSEDLKYDYVITHFVELCTLFFKEIKKIYPSKIICIDHNPRPLEGFPIIKKIKNALKGILYSQYIDQFVGVSKYTKKHILKDYGFYLNNKTIVIYNGIDTSVFFKKNNDNKNKFYVASHLRESKGIQDLLEALNLLESEVKNQIIIDIYGEGPLENYLKKMSADFNLNEIVYFRGSSSKLNEIAFNYNYLLQPTHMECFSLSILESLAANVPVITTTVGGNLEVVTNNENGFIFEPKNIYQLSDILKNIVSEKIKIEIKVNTLIENEFNLDKMVQNHLALLI